MSTGRRIFVSYSHVERAVVERLERDLESLGCDVWCDSDITGGQRWWDGILENIRQCDVFVFAISESSVRSDACERELEYATALGKPLLPVLAGEPGPEGLLPPILSETQRVDVRESDARSALALGRALMQTPAAPPLPDVLPAPPPVPVTYLSDLKARVEATSIPVEDQWKLLTEIEECLTRPEEQDAALTLLRRFADRGDLMQGVAVAARRVLAGHDGDPPVTSTAPTLAPAADEPSVGGGGGGRKWIVIAAAGVLIAGAVTAGVVLLQRDDGSDESSLDEFCDRARSADLATDRANAFLVRPEADPAEVERLFTQGAEEMDAVALAAPDDIREATEGLTDAVDVQLRALGDNDWQLAGVAAELVAVDPVASQQNLEFGDYLRDQCGIEWNEVGGFTDVSTAAEALATAFTAGALELGVTADEAECMSTELTDQIDADRLLALYGKAVAVTQEESLILVGALESCVDTERMVPGFTAINFEQLPDTTEEQQSCLSRGVLDEVTLTVWAETTVATPEVTDQLRTIAEECDVDPRLVLPLVGG